jgi:hypothetical protein
VSDFVGQHFAAIIAVMYVALVGWSIYSKHRAEGLAGEGRCASCGASGTSSAAPAGEGVLCSSCAAKRSRHDRIAVPLWLAIIAFAGTMLVIEVSDSVREHRAIQWESAGGLAVACVGCAWLVLRYRMRGAGKPQGHRAAEQGHEADKVRAGK